MLLHHAGIQAILVLSIQVNELKRDIIIGIVEKVQETSPGTGMHNRAITVLHELRMCLGKQRHTQITLCNLVTI